MLFLSPLFFFFSLTIALPTNGDDTHCSPFFYPEGCFSNEIGFKRVVFHENLRKETSIYLRGYSPESILLHTLLVFSDDIAHYHNTLLINPLHFSKYLPLVHTSDFAFNNEFVLITKGREILLQYDIAPLSTGFFDGSSGTSYDAVLRLDYYSSLWNEYNTWSIERSHLTLKRVEPEQWKKKDVSQEDFNGYYHLWCNRSKSLKKCYVELPRKLRINGRHAHDPSSLPYGLLLDPNLQYNLLPHDLFLRWKYEGERDFLLEDDRGEEIFFLNSQFEYGINSESQEIVLGVDFLHHFQRIEYNLEAGYYRFFFSHIYHSHENFEWGRLLITLFISTMLFGVLFYWMTSPNYHILKPVLEKDTYFLFPFRIVWCEILSLGIALVLWILTLIFTESMGSETFHYSHSDHKRRTILFILFSLYNALLLVIFLCWNWPLTKAAWRYYYAYIIFHTQAQRTDRDYPDLVRMIEMEERKIHPRYVITRNIFLHNIAATNLLLILNYLSEDMLIYFILLVGVSLTIVYYNTKLLSVSILYLARNSQEWRDLWVKHSGFFGLFLLNFIVYVIFIGFSLPTTYYSLLRELNSMYSDVIIWVFTIQLLVFVLSLAISVVFYLVLKILRNTPPDSVVKVKELTKVY